MKIIYILPVKLTNDQLPSIPSKFILVSNFAIIEECEYILSVHLYISGNNNSFSFLQMLLLEIDLLMSNIINFW